MSHKCEYSGCTKSDTFFVSFPDDDEGYFCDDHAAENVYQAIYSFDVEKIEMED